MLPTRHQYRSQLIDYADVTWRSSKQI